MQVTTITVKAGRTFNHPLESYSNLRCDLAMSASLDAGEDPIEAAKSLRTQCESMCEEHKQEMLESIMSLEERKRKTARRISLKNQMDSMQEELADLESEDQQMIPQLIPPYEQ